VLTGYATTFGVLICYRVLVGVGEASYATISPSLISDNFPAARRNQALTIFYVAIPVGAALGNVLGGQIATHYSWRDAFIWAGAPGLLLALVLLPFQEPQRGQAEETPIEGRAKPTLKDVPETFCYSEIPPGGARLYGGHVRHGRFWQWGPSFFVRVHGMPLDAAGNLFGEIMVVTGLLGTFIGGFIASAWQKRNRAGYALLLGCSTLGAVPFAVLALPCANAFFRKPALRRQCSCVLSHRPGQHVDSGNRARESPRQRHGALDLHDSLVRRHVVHGNRRAAGG